MRRMLESLLVVSTVLAQTSAPLGRDAAQDAYRKWRDTDPNLEREAASAGATAGARADKAAAEGAKYFAVRKAYLDALAAEANQNASTVEPVTVTPAATPSMEAFLNAQNTLLGSNIEVIARDPDRGIQQLRQALERERTAIAALNAGLHDIQAQDAVERAAANAELLRAKTSEAYRKLAAGLNQSAQLTGESGTAWANYYRALSDAARGVGSLVTSSAPAASAPSSPSPVTVANPAPARGITPVPLSRYVGEWTYPAVGAHYHGAQPESVDLVIREENGRASGTLSARFKLPPGDAAGSPVVSFDFTGAFQNSRSQTFSVTTGNGAPGTLELIPGPAFNLLEVNFNTDEKSGTVRQANFLLLKK
jgi:hypothetical protein